MYNSGLDNAMADRATLRKMAFTQVYGSSYHSQSAKERFPYRNMSQHTYSSRCYTSAPGGASNCSPCPTTPTAQGCEPMPVCPNFWHSQSSLLPQSAYWFEKDSDWSHADHSAYKAFGQEYHVNVNQGMA